MGGVTISNEERLEKMADTVDSIGPEFLIREAFLGYKYRKEHKKLYISDNDNLVFIPEKLIRLYYGLNPTEANFNTMKKAFITHYINNESEIEGIEKANIHNNLETRGLAVMYDYIHSNDINYMFDVYTLKDLHRKLFTYAKHPECAGDFRNFSVFLPGTGTELCPWYMIREELNKIDVEVQELVKESKKIREYKDIDALIRYIERCVIVKCKLIKVHPFGDGNGRTIRGFVNKLFEDAGLPPVYIKVNERTEYQKAMNLANNESDYTHIINFYKYKICDSIIELDINERTATRKIDTQIKRKVKTLSNN